MNLKKRISLITALVMLMTFTPFGIEINQERGQRSLVFKETAYASGTWDSGTGYWGDNITASVDGNTLTLSGSGNINHFGVDTNKNLLRGIDTLVIEDGIIEIGIRAFRHNQLRTVVIGNSVTSIGDQTFERNEITSLTIPSSANSIGAGAFNDNQLASVEIPEGVVSIGGSAFRHNQLRTVTIPSSVNSIVGWVFADNQLTSVEIPEGVVSIGSSAFRHNQLRTVTIPSSVTSIERSVFSHNQLTSIDILDSVTSIENGAFNSNQLTHITIPESVTSIGSRAFAENQIVSVTIGENVRIENGEAWWPSRTMGNNEGLRDFYFSNNSAAGTYQFIDDQWVFLDESAIPVKSVSLNKSTLTLTEGDSETLKAIVYPSNATNQNVTWKSSNSSVARVNSNGQVTAVAYGNTRITVTTEDGNNTATCSVMVERQSVAPEPPPQEPVEASKPAAGDGSASNPFEIANPGNLLWIQEQTNNGGDWSRDKYFIQTADIDLSAIENWEPIGIGEVDRGSSTDTSFKGNYNGQFFTINNLNIDRGSENYVGLFGHIHGATLQNIILQNIDVTGRQRVGGLFGSSNKYSFYRNPPDVHIIQVSVQGTVKGNANMVGGIGGNPAQNTFMNNSNVFVGSVEGTGDVGGLAGRTSNNSMVSKSYARADVKATSSNGSAGILVGSTSANASSFKEAYAVGTATGDNAGVIGIIESTSDSFRDIYYDKNKVNTFGGNAVRGYNPETQENNVIGLTSAQMQGASAAQNMTGSDGRWDFTERGTWRTTIWPKDDYPVFAWEPEGHGEEEPPAPDPVDHYTVSITVSPPGSGTVSGADIYEEGERVAVTSENNPGYEFVNWTEGGHVVSTDSVYTFTVSGDRHLTANFRSTEDPGDDTDESNDYITWPSKTNIDPAHNWTIQFNEDVNSQNVNNNFIWVEDSAKNRLSANLSSSGRTVFVTFPPGGYQPGETYELFISAELRSQTGQLLRQGVRMKFTIAEPELKF